MSLGSSKPPFNLPEGFRLIEVTDTSRQFQTGDSRIDSYTLNDYFRWSTFPHNYVILYEWEGDIAGVIHMIVYSDYIFIEIVARNRSSRATGVGTKLISLIEGIARQLGKSRILLHSLDTTVEWYKKLGFRIRAPPRRNTEFGILTPMEKILE